MTDKEKAIVMAYTGIAMLVGDKFDIFHQYIEEKMGRPIWSHELAFKEMWAEIKEATKEDFNRLCRETSPEAIPIEWIGKWWDKQPLDRDSVFFLLRDWERETGIDAAQHAEVIREMRSQKAGEKENESGK